MPVWSCFDFVADVFLIGLTPLMPTLQVFIFFIGLTFDCQTWSCFDFLWKTLICLNYLLSSEGLSEAFIGYKIIFHSASLFQIRKKISDAMCHALYDCARMKCPSIFWIIFSFSSFLVLTIGKCECHMQMPWLVLPIRYATIVPLYAIDRLLTTDLDVNFLMNANKMWCKSRFFISDTNAFHNDADAKCSYDADVPCKGAGARFIHDGASAHIYSWCKCLLTEMEMQNILWCKCLLMGVS